MAGRKELCRIVDVDLESKTVTVQTADSGRIIEGVPFRPHYYSPVSGACAIMVPEEGAMGFLEEHNGEMVFVSYESLWDTASESYYPNLPDDTDKGDWIVRSSSGALFRVRASDVIEFFTSNGIARFELVGKVGMLRGYAEQLELHTIPFVFKAGPSVPVEDATGFMPQRTTIDFRETSDPGVPPVMHLEVGATSLPMYLALLTLADPEKFSMVLNRLGVLTWILTKLNIVCQQINLGPGVVSQLVKSEAFSKLVDLYNTHTHSDNGEPTSSQYSPVSGGDYTEFTRAS